MPSSPRRDGLVSVGDVKLHFVHWGEQGRQTLDIDLNRYAE